MKKHKFKPKEIKTRGVVPGIKTICGICKKGMWDGHILEVKKIISNIQMSEENYPIKKLQPYRKYKVPTLNNKINEIIEWLNKHEEENTVE
ncbi:MAG: hypothetical protein AABY22_28610 [Nanoarchaeota archaeon]